MYMGRSHIYFSMRIIHIFLKFAKIVSFKKRNKQLFLIFVSVIFKTPLAVNN